MLKQVQHDGCSVRMVIGWKLPHEDREQLLERFPPKYEKVIADHVTLRVGGKELPPKPEARIVGRADDGRSLECLVAELDGTTDRPDGSTWSLGPHRKAVESNDVLRDLGWEKLSAPIPIELEPARF